MVVVKLYGGLGNQMFQYATARSLALRNSDILKLDLSWFKNTGNNIERPFELGIFNIEADEVIYNEVKKFLPKNRLFSILGLYDHKKYIREKGFIFDPSILNLKGDVYLDGYWQSWKYFKDFESEIKKIFVLNTKHTSEMDRFVSLFGELNNSVSLHIRRGDYVDNAKTNAFHGTCSIDYYKKSIEYIKNKVGDINLFIFSDDIEWAKKQELFYSATFVSRKTIKYYEDIELMSKCNHNIIANSSFSWWSAWLNKNPDKIVVAPKKWFNVPKDTKDLIPDNWVRI